MIVYLIGFMGAGKSTLGSALANELHFDFIDLDELIEKNEGESISEIFKTKGEEYFRILERHTLKNLLVDSSNTIIACGGGTPCFHENMEWMNEQGLTIYLDVSVKEILRRLGNNPNNRPLLSQNNPIKLLKSREDIYKQAKYVLKQDGTLSEWIEEIKMLLSSPF